MERKRTTKKSEEGKTESSTLPIKPRWKKITRGTIYPFPNQRNKRVKPFEVISATEEEIVKFREHFELVQDGTGQFKTKNPAKTVTDTKRLATPVEKESYKVIPVGEGLYGVESPAGKKINDDGLTKEAAEELKATLEKETTED